MPKQSGACVTCRELTFWRDKRILPMGRCARCGDRLIRPGTREYAVIAFALEAARRAKVIHGGATPRWEFAWLMTQPMHPINVAIADNMARWARDLAHTARRLYPHLRFEFETDAKGRVIDLADAC